MERPLSLDELRFELEMKGWNCVESGYGPVSKVCFRLRYPSSREASDYALAYSTEAGKPQLCLTLADKPLLTIGYPPRPSELVKVFKLCPWRV